MGRAKLETKYREDRRARLTTYLNRLKGTKKKACELSILCGVDALIVSFSSDLNATDCWPEDPTTFCSIADHYLRCRWRKLSPLLPSSTFPSFHEEFTALEAKLEEVRERIRFLGSAASKELLDFALSNQVEDLSQLISSQCVCPLPTVDEFDLEFPMAATPSISIAETDFNLTRSIDNGLCDDSYFNSASMDDDLIASVASLVSIFSDDVIHQL